ncbi:hypothetical protein [Maridesulfovibrio sp.]|uniref:hypothetical protein n=1 Tax=Maridesulfovibrio sp. TaxID=2795000 RepID=UPI002A18C976|nr:hypothetical protein [Maridesulfovibrio sp.]
MLVLTDLTRFKDNDNVCMALLDENNCHCYRPLPYADRDFVSLNNIRPGVTVSADVVPATEVNEPHVEDCLFENAVWQDRLDEESFHLLLQRDAVDSVHEAFEGLVTPQNRCVPAGTPCCRSIRTVRIDPLSLSVSTSESEEGMKLRMGFTDVAGDRFRHTPIADLCFHAEALRYAEQDRLDELNALLAGGETVYIRIGLSRLYQSRSGKQGFWMQANGIYVFPGCFLG